ncbi:MAG: Cytochrome c biogenesis factor [Candidatus Methanohalarchaeum thermophilum]|uniref:Cytochrome c biogenesis factor n=1 Tax=Methanohalarchaeum thermophilum TaxID=1903181 RepID=A0A1Q6DXI6_METT1|nr:MAG: Cytochrome c biogenesis factor [Candidatus Methanohalarchaeum thermophilum]
MDSFYEKVNLNDLFLATAILLGIIAFIVFLGIILGYGPADKSYYNFRTGFVMLVLLFVLSACLFLRLYGPRDAFQISIGALAITIFNIILSPVDSIFFNASVPILFVVAFGILIEFIKILRRDTSLYRKSKEIGPHVVHLAIVVILFGVIISSVMGVSEQHRFSSDDKNWEFQGYEIEFMGVDSKDMGFAEKYFYNFLISKEGKALDEVEIVEVKKIKSSYRPGIYSDLKKDIYLSLRGVSESSVVITAKTTPLSSFLWGGTIMLGIGILLREIGSISREQMEKAKDNEAESYEKKFKRELEKHKKDK